MVSQLLHKHKIVPCCSLCHIVLSCLTISVNLFKFKNLHGTSGNLLSTLVCHCTQFKNHCLRIYFHYKTPIPKLLSRKRICLLYQNYSWVYSVLIDGSLIQS